MLGLVIGFFGTLVLVLTDIMTKKEIAEMETTLTVLDKSDYLRKELKKRSQSAQILAIVLTVSFAFQLTGLASS